MNATRVASESGRQRGFVKPVEVDGEIHLCDAAIQKYNGRYFVHVSQISESNMTSGVYCVYFTRSFDSIDDAIATVEPESPIRFVEFGPLKGS